MNHYNRNDKDVARVEDVKKINLKELSKADLIIGGPPCQGFSIAGRARRRSEAPPALSAEATSSGPCARITRKAQVNKSEQE